MAGGIGSRFWPMSDTENPKQFLDILGCGKTLLQLTAERFEGICPVENLIVVTSQKYKEIVKKQLPQIPIENILLEPCRRNTAPCIAYASWAIKQRNLKANIVVTPSDHHIVEIEKFQECIKSCLNYTAETDSIVTLGIRPTHPETGYGYIQAELSYASPTNHNIYRVDSFKEKPSIELAKEYMKQNNYFWNSGIFIWNVQTIVNAFRVYQPTMAEIFESMRSDFNTPREAELIEKNFPRCNNISVDYAIMEYADEIYVYPAEFGWTDLGTWSSLKTHLSNDLYNNATIGDDVKLYETNNCIVHTAGLKKVVVQGLDGFIVAEKDGILLICKMEEEQRIKLFHD